MLGRLIQYYKILNNISSNKKRLFIFNYKKMLFPILEIGLKYFMAYNFKTNK